MKTSQFKSPLENFVEAYFKVHRMNRREIVFAKKAMALIDDRLGNAVTNFVTNEDNGLTLTVAGMIRTLPRLRARQLTKAKAIIDRYVP